MTRPNPHIALIYHYDLARALDGEPVDWQATPVNVDAGREGGDLCRAAADFAKRRDLFAMPASSKETPCSDTTSSTSKPMGSTTASSTALPPAGSTTARASMPSSLPPTQNSTPTSLTSSQSLDAGPTSPSNQVAGPSVRNYGNDQPVAEPEPVAPARSAAQVSATNDEITAEDHEQTMDDIVRRPWAYDEADPRFEGKAS